MKSIRKHIDHLNHFGYNYLNIGIIRLLILLFILSFLKSCIVPYYPDRLENETMLIVEGMITDQHEINTIKLSMTQPLWKTGVPNPLKGCKVWITDDLGQTDSLKEKINGTYYTDTTAFQGKIGRKYVLHIFTNAEWGNMNYESYPMEMKPVPEVDNIYYEKTTLETNHIPVEGCQIYLDTHDPLGRCSFYRWQYSETWEFHLPYNVRNKICWITEKSNKIFIKNTSILSEDRVQRYLINTINNPVDKLSAVYSINVLQYSLNEDEYLYWERLKSTSDQVGSLYDLIPAIIPNNVFCVENPREKILGFFSVSAVASKRLFIKDNFIGWNIKYTDCIDDTIYGTNPIERLNTSVWVIIDHSAQTPPSRIVTYKKGCADCTDRGTTIKPAFWDVEKKLIPD